MKHYIGIDLGTSNSAISSFDGETVKVWKSPDQNEVTPSVLYFGPRGSRYVGKQAYDYEPHDPENAAKLFKRMLGTSTKYKIRSTETELTPEECSAEILKSLFGYLPEEIRRGGIEGTVITVPAAFNQMKKEATLQAAKLADIGKVALMQEPVAAVMSVMKAKGNDGTFLVYDLGGGTLDVAIAEATGGKVNLLSHGGIEMCGGRDFDRALMERVVGPWLEGNFDLPADWSQLSEYKTLHRMALWAAERTKIELSAKEESRIILSEIELRQKDRSGKEIWLDIPLSRAQLDEHIVGKVQDSVDAAREAIKKAGLAVSDIERVVFVGGPTQYKPLRDMVCRELGVPGSNEVDPMTAVSTGAAVFAESLSWDTVDRNRKSAKGGLASAGAVAINFEYTSRTSATRAKIVAKSPAGTLTGFEYQIDSLEDGWSSGRKSMADSTDIDLPLGKLGESSFKVFVFDQSGGPVKLNVDKISIVRTSATITAIPASHSIGIEVNERVGGRSSIEWLVRAGDSLPASGKRTFRTLQELKAGKSDSILFKLLEGEIEDPVSDNRPVGGLKVSGADFEEGVVPVGSEIECTFKISDSGAIELEVSIAAIGASFGRGRNFYSRQEGQIDFTKAAGQVKAESAMALERVIRLESVVKDERLSKTKKDLEKATEKTNESGDPEKSMEALEQVLTAKRSLANIRKDHLKAIRQFELAEAIAFFNDHARKDARPSDTDDFDVLVRAIERSIEKNDTAYDDQMDSLRSKAWDVLWRQDWFIVQRFHYLAQAKHLFPDEEYFDACVIKGKEALQKDDIGELKVAVARLDRAKYRNVDDDDMLRAANISKVQK